MKVNLYNRKNEVVGQIDIPDAIFAAPWRPELVKQVLVALSANRRRPWAHAKGRGEVRGGGKKPWRQKGTGRSRHGSIRSPLWPGGGVTHGPLKERDYSQKINKKMRQGALRSALSRKLKDNEVKFFDTLAMETAKTNELFKTLAGILNLAKRAKKLDVILVTDPAHKELFRASRNLTKAKAVSPTSLNIEDILSHKQVFIESAALPIMEKVYSLATKGS